VWSTRVSARVRPAVGHGVRVKGRKQVGRVKPPSTPRARGLAVQVATRARVAAVLEACVPPFPFMFPTKGVT
jgi:hypothetical protein